jgi:hypothetical protein
MGDQNLSRRGFLKLTGLLPGLLSLVKKLAEGEADQEQEFDESACQIEGNEFSFLDEGTPLWLLMGGDSLFAGSSMEGIPWDSKEQNEIRAAGS